MVCCPCIGGEAPRSGCVTLNVGGTCYTTTRETLKACPKLEQIVAGKPGMDGAYFLDRDGRYFAEVLNFCRDGPEAFTAPVEEEARRVLQREAQFFGLEGLAAMVRESYCGAPLPSNEQERLQRLEGLNILHSNEQDFHYDSITRVVSAVLDTPIALISLVHKEFQWFKSRVGIEANSTPRNTSFCAFTFLPEDPKAAQMFLIEDALCDSRVSQNPLVVGEPGIRFYAGCPLVTSDGMRLGALCAIDRKPRSISAGQAQMLVNLAQICVQEVEREQLTSKTDEDMEAEFDGVPMSADFATGPLRIERMREALDEAVVLVRVRVDSDDWPILYGNKSFTELSGIRITPPDRLQRRATPSGVGMRAISRMGAQQELGLWDWLQLTGKGERQLRKELRATWDQPDANIFAVTATAPALATGGSGYVSRGAGADRVPVTCRFVPCELPLDVTAEAIRPVPQRDSGKPIGEQRVTGRNANERFYFVTMRRVAESDMCPMVMSSNSGVDSANTTPTRKADRKNTGKGLEAAGHIKPPRSPFLDVRLVRLVGSGSFGKVFYGLWMGSPVAVKIVETKATDKSRKFEPIFEAALSASIAHPNLVQTFKYSTRAKPVEDNVEEEPTEEVFETWMVQEWCDRGTLGSYCQTLRTNEESLPEVLDISADIAAAGSYLHSRGIIHGDLTANNVLIKTQVSRKGYVCKICDFGLARVLEGNNVDIVTTQLGTVTHMPPELFELGKEVKLTAKADVYAAGVLLWQAIQGQSPFQGLSPPQVVVQIIKGKKLMLPEETPQEIKEVFDKCTATNPKERPTFDELVAFFAGTARSSTSSGA